MSVIIPTMSLISSISACRSATWSTALVGLVLDLLDLRRGLGGLVAPSLGARCSFLCGVGDVDRGGGDLLDGRGHVVHLAGDLLEVLGLGVGAVGDLLDRLGDLLARRLDPVALAATSLLALLTSWAMSCTRAMLSSTASRPSSMFAMTSPYAPGGRRRGPGPACLPACPYSRAGAGRSCPRAAGGRRRVRASPRRSHLAGPCAVPGPGRPR